MNPPDIICEICEAQPGEWCQSTCSEAPQPMLFEELVKMQNWTRLKTILRRAIPEHTPTEEEMYDLLEFMDENWGAVPREAEFFVIHKHVRDLRKKIIELQSLIREYVRTFEAEVKEFA